MSLIELSWTAKHKKMSENGEIYTADKNFTLPPAVTALTNSTSGYPTIKIDQLLLPFLKSVVIT